MNITEEGLQELLTPVIAQKVSEAIASELKDYFMQIITPIIKKESEQIAKSLSKILKKE